MSECLGVDQLNWERCVGRDRKFLLEDSIGSIACSTCVSSEISHLRQEAKRLEQLSHEDDLTGLPNRRYLQQRFSELAQEDDTFGLLYVDIINFGLVNSKNGHDSGDRMLINVAEFLSFDTKKMDGHAARLGGDEFGLLVRVGDKTLLDTVASRLRTEFLEQEFTIAYNSRAKEDEQLGLNIGTAMHSKNMTYAELQVCADPKGRGLKS